MSSPYDLYLLIQGCQTAASNQSRSFTAEEWQLIQVSAEVLSCYLMLQFLTYVLLHSICRNTLALDNQQMPSKEKW